MSLLLYSALWYCALPVVLLRLFWRARRQPEYLSHVGERLGRYSIRSAAPVVWVHAVSVGETRAAQALIDRLLVEWPDHTVLLTHMTPTGRQTASELYGNQARVKPVYLPYDLTPAVKRFLSHFKPSVGIIMETELWPRLLHECKRRQIPVVLANARLSARSAGRYARWPGLTRLTLGSLTAIAAQTPADAGRLQALGAQQVAVTGNIKFDIVPPEAMTERSQILRERAGERHILLAASTRDGEEALILDAFGQLHESKFLLLIVPRHPQRFDEVCELVRSRGYKMQRRSDESDIRPDTEVWVGDSMGEMFAYYRAADIALIGGSWLPFGAQNLIEACAVGTPVLVGPHTFNFQLVAEQAVAAGAARRCTDVVEAIKEAARLTQHPGEAEFMRQAGLAFSKAHRGASQRTLDLIKRTATD